jgi:hypothetical protein
VNTSERIRAGDQIGRWTVLSDAPRRNRKRRVTCRCECGTTRIVWEYKLQNRSSLSCGCYAVDRIKEAKTTHGLSLSSEYRIWIGIRKRCVNSNDPLFRYYGGRGIQLLWPDFASFYADMGPRPSTAYSIDRIDNDGHYCRENCRWATDAEQARNMRTNRLITHNGRTMTLTDWAHHAGLRRTTLARRLDRGWTVDMAISTAVTSRQV